MLPLIVRSWGWGAWSMEGSAPRLGYLVSTVVHLVLVMLLINRTTTMAGSPPPPVPEASLRAPAVFLPPAEVLRQLRREGSVRPLPATPHPPSPVPTPMATPPPGRDRISIGGPSAERTKGPLVLRREDDLTSAPRGTPQGDRTDQRVPAMPPPSPEPPPTRPVDGVAAGGPLRLPPGIGRPEPSAAEAPGGPPRPASLAETLRNLDRRIAQAGPQGTAIGTGRQMGPLFFDPQGADFTPWINHFKNEVYRNWIAPQAALLGARGHVDLEFTVERDGRMRDLRISSSAGNPALDRAAQNALLASRLLPLPSDFAPPELTMRVTFFYNEEPQGS